MTKVKVQDNGIRTVQAESAADVLIVEISEATVVNIVSEGIDFIVILMVKADTHKAHYFHQAWT